MPYTISILDENIKSKTKKVLEENVRIFSRLGVGKFLKYNMQKKH